MNDSYHTEDLFARSLRVEIYIVILVEARRSLAKGTFGGLALFRLMRTNGISDFRLNSSSCLLARFVLVHSS